MLPMTNQRGFTLMELIIVIVLLGILASGAGLLITKPIEAYNDQLRRQQLVDQGEMALRQIARDIRRALPNSLRVDATGSAIEMVNTIGGARYRDEVGGVFIDPVDDILGFTSVDTAFNLLGRLNLTALQLLNQRLVIYNTVPADAISNIYSDAVIGDLGVMTPAGTTLGLSDASSGVEEHRITLSAAFQFSQQSPGQRIFVVDGPISYVCDTGTATLTRYDSYPYQSTQTLAPAGAESGLVVSQLKSCSFTYDAGSTQRGGIVTMEIVLDDATSESISLLHQVHVVNVP